MDIRDQPVIVTGGASGLGAATARRLSTAGARVTVFDVDGDRGSALATELGALFVRVDVTSEQELDRGPDVAEHAHGTARVLVNCAGISPIAASVDASGSPHSDTVFRRAIEVNLYGTALLLYRFAARAASAEPIGEERGVIINTASIAAYDGQVGMTAYAASKAAVIGMTLPAARDLAPHGLRVVTIAPGMFRTDMVAMLDDAGKDRLGRQVPMPNRLGHPDEYAMLVEHIVANPMLNGEVIRLDGAHRLPGRA